MEELAAKLSARRKFIMNKLPPMVLTVKKMAFSSKTLNLTKVEK